MSAAEYIMRLALVFTAGGRPQEQNALEAICKFS